MSLTLYLGERLIFSELWEFLSAQRLRLWSKFRQPSLLGLVKSLRVKNLHLIL